MKLDKLHSLIARLRPKVESQQTPLHLVAWQPARLLLSISPLDIKGAQVNTRGRQKIIGSTRHISESELIIHVLALQSGGWRIIEGHQFKMELELEPAREVIEMRVVVLGHEPETVEGEESGQLILLRIEGMNQNHRARYLGFLGSRGW